MRGLNDTLGRLRALRQRAAFAVEGASDQLARFADFGSNPGKLKAWAHVPDNLPKGAPLVVVLHGCTQDAGGYDRGAGWSAAADRHGFAVLFPEQQRSNNPNLCFNWFNPMDASRGGGEALSIRQMVAAFQARHGTAAGSVFVTGLSAGGAMAAVMLATYPEVFAGGAVIAGLPFGTAQSVPEAFERMRRQSDIDPAALAALVRSASSHRGQWPSLSVWHGTTDATVDSSNATALVEQWRALHGLAEAPSTVDTVNGYPRKAWRDAAGREVIEEYVITGLGHGTPLSSFDGSAETAGPYMLEAGISSTERALEFWGIAAERPAIARPRAASAGGPMSQRSPARVPTNDDAPGTSKVQKVIEEALRSAGLMR